MCVSCAFFGACAPIEVVVVMMREGGECAQLASGVRRRMRMRSCGERSVASLPRRRRAAATTTPLKIQTPPRVMRMVYDFIYP